MVKLIITIWLCIPGWAAQSPNVVATVNGQPIYEAELTERLRNLPPGEGSATEELDRLILYKLAVQQARATKLQRKPEVKTKIDRVLYESFLKENLVKAQKQLEPTETDLKLAYSKQPYIRLRQLVLLAQTPEQKLQSQKTSKKIASEIAANADFKQLVLKYSQNDSLRFAGDLDFRGVNKLPPPIYSVALKLKKNEISGPIDYGQAIHYIQRTDTKPFSSVPATYMSFLSRSLRKERELDFLNSVLKKLKEKSLVQVFQPGTPLP